MTHQEQTKGWTSASNAAADLLCQPRHTLQRGIPESKSLDASYGDRIHKALATDNPEGLDTKEQDIYESCQAIAAKKVAEFFGIKTGEVLRFNERRLWASFSSGLRPGQRLQHSGQADRIYRHGARLLIPDFKTLAGDTPESPLNLQLRDLAVLASKELIADEVGVLVIQPLVTHDPEITLYTKADLAQAKEEMFVRVDKSNYPDGEPTPGDPQCKYCRAKVKCVPYQRWAAGMVVAVSTILDVPVESWSPEQRKLFCDRFSIAQKWLNETWDAMEAGVKADPAFVPGYQMFPGAIRKKIVNPQEVFTRFVNLAPEDLNITQAFLETVTIGKGKLRDAVAKLTSSNGQKLNKTLKQLLDGCEEDNPTKDVLRASGGEEAGAGQEAA